MKSLKQIFSVMAVFSVLSLAFFSCSKNKSKDDLANTEWKGMANIPQRSEVVLKFTEDQLDLLFENRIIESMDYSIKDNHIILAKISGGSPCEVGLKGEYQYEVVGDNFVINLIKDDCVARTISLKDNVFNRLASAKKTCSNLYHKAFL